MKKTALFVCAILIVCILCSCLVACGEKEKEEVLGFTDIDNQYLLIYDDFTGDTLNSELWNVYGSNGECVRRGGYWDPNQVLVQNNRLVIRTSEIDGKYYTGAIDSKDKFEQGYGYYEARCKLPKATGLWSAFWLMSVEMEDGINDSPDVNKVGAEIDIFESPFYNGGLGNDFYQFNIHVGDYGNNYIQYGSKHLGENAVHYSTVVGSKDTLSIYDDWHTFALEWTEGYYKFYIDRYLVGEVTDSRFISPLKDFLFLSVEVNGSNGVAEGMQFFGGLPISENENGTFPVDFEVDWVAVYSQKPF